MPLDWLRSIVGGLRPSDMVDPVAAEIAQKISNADERFNRCIPLVLKHEGGYVNDPNDPGGATNYGISLRYARTMGSMFDLDRDGDVDKHDILLVKPEFASTVYRQWFWADVRGDELRAGIDYSMFDFAVNSGPGRAIKIAQTVCGVEVDGFIGPKTMAALQTIDAAHFVEKYNERRLAFLRSLSGWKHYGRGWSNRVSEVTHEARLMVKP